MKAPFDPASTKKHIAASILLNITAWSAYAAIEILIDYISLFFGSSHNSTVLHGGFVAALIAFYSFVGICTGCAFGMGLSIIGRFLKGLTDERRVCSVLSALSTSFLIAGVAFVSVFNSHVVTPKKTIAVFFCLLLFIHIASIFSFTWFKKLWVLVNAYITSLIAALFPWIIERASGNFEASKDLAISLSIILIFLMIYYTPMVFLHKKIFFQGTGANIYQAKRMCFFNMCILLIIVMAGIVIHYQKKNYIACKNIFPSIATIDYSAKYPNIILVIMDTVRADHLSLYGYKRKTTPHLELFSQTATVYTNAISPSDMTLSSTAALFTGMYPSRHGAHNDAPAFPWGKPLDYNATTIAEGLASKGYISAAVSSNHLYISRDFHLDQGFAYFDSKMRVPFLRTNDYSLNLRTSFVTLLKKFFITPKLTVTHRLGAEITDNIFAVLESLNQANRPFFMFVNYMDAHDPYIPPKPFDRLFSNSSTPMFSQDGFMQYVREVNSLKRPVTPIEKNHFVSQYDGAIAFIDFCLGKLFAYLKEHDLFENSLIIITSDHGEAFGEKSLFGHGVSVYQNQIHVPLIIKYPHQQKNTLYEGAVSLTDILPTIFETVDYPVPDEVQGMSLINPRKTRSNPIISESFPWGILLDWHERFHRVERAYFDFPLKLIHSTKGKQELYDLSQDPFEENVLNLDNASIASQNTEKLLSFVEGMTTAKQHSIIINDQQVERLKGLGYLK